MKEEPERSKNNNKELKNRTVNKLEKLVFVSNTEKVKIIIEIQKDKKVSKD